MAVGGGKGSGAPIGSHNALKHGLISMEANKVRKAIKELFNKLIL